MRKKYVWVSLRGVIRLIWVDTLRKVNNVGFPVERLIFKSVNGLSYGTVSKLMGYAEL